ncbi:MAG: hypothetical protein COB29_12740 [Sulfitobacter sp.]|nr:MAG: hypothetical protein COB29_12740 [Sulfitobacter sp.]
MPSPNLVPIMSHITPEERETLRGQAKSLNITVSSFVRRVVTGCNLPSTQHHKDIRDLVTVSADLARLGNLFKLALDDEDFNELQKKEGLDALSVMGEIDQTRKLLKQTIDEIRRV